MPKQLNDFLMLTDVLTHLKDLMTLSATATKESSCENMRAMLVKTSGRTAQNQFAVFEFMNGQGWYPVENEDPKTVQETIAKYENVKG